MNIEILVCTHNRVQLLDTMLTSINESERPDDVNISLLVVANACTDGTVEYLKKYPNLGQGKLSLRWVEEGTPGKSHALNRGLAMVEADIISFIDDDQRVARDYFVCLVEAIERKPEFEMLCGRLLPDWDGSEPVWVHNNSGYALRPLPVPNFDLGEHEQVLGLNGRFPQGGNLIVRRSMLRRVGTFSIALGPHGHDLGGGEDSDYIYRALREGAKLLYVPSVVQFHFVEGERCTLPYIMKKAFLRTKSVVMVENVNASAPPKYLYRKIFLHLLKLITSLYMPRTRYYLVRLAATAGELNGYWCGWRQEKNN